MYIEISIGEALDRLSILEIKQKEIKDDVKIAYIKKEIETLKDILHYKELYSYYYNLLNEVNSQIWNNTNRMKTLNYKTLEFGEVANNIFEFNDARFRVKNIINRLSGANIQEQKSFNRTQVDIDIKDTDSIDINMLSNLSLKYDSVCVHCSAEKKIDFEVCVPKFNYTFVLD